MVAPRRLVTSHFSPKGWSGVLDGVFATPGSAHVDGAHFVVLVPRRAVIVAGIVLHCAVRVFRGPVLTNREAEAAHG